MRISRQCTLLVISALCVLSMAPGRGCNAVDFFSSTPAPDVGGTDGVNWNVTYDNEINVTIDIGGDAINLEPLTANGGQVGFLYEGETITFDLDCSLPAVVCPNELLPDRVRLEQRDFEDHPHQVHLPFNETVCQGDTRLPVEADGECGGETEISCDEEICDGLVVEQESTALATINDPEAEVGDTPDYHITIPLDAGITGFEGTYGICLGLSTTHAEGDITYTGSYDTATNNMTATEINGEIVVNLIGGCMTAWDAGGDIGAALAGARITIWSNFQATRGLL